MLIGPIPIAFRVIFGSSCSVEIVVQLTADPTSMVSYLPIGWNCQSPSSRNRGGCSQELKEYNKEHGAVVEVFTRSFESIYVSAQWKRCYKHR